jgi:hypothetical protein
MAGLGLGPPEFALFEIDDPDERADSLERVARPGRQRLGVERHAGKGVPKEIDPGIGLRAEHCAEQSGQRGPLERDGFVSHGCFSPLMKRA